MRDLIIALAMLATANGQYPQTERSLAFNLIANITDTSKLGIFKDPIQNWPLTTTHTGAGIATAILASSTNHLFFVNGTAEEEAAMETTMRLPPLMCRYSQDPESWGMHFQQSTIAASGYLGIHIDRAERGAGIIGSTRSPYPILFAPEPFRALKFMVCNETEYVYGRPQYGIKQAEEVPDNCAEMVLLAQCTKLWPVPMLNVTEWGWQVREVDCYRNVSAIDWNAS